jgi:hypothetical protein
LVVFNIKLLEAINGVAEEDGEEIACIFFVVPFFLNCSKALEIAFYC